MGFLPRLPNGVRRLLRLPLSRARIRRELDDEVQTHLAMRIDDLRERGMSEQDAEREAMRRFGDAGDYAHYAERRAVRHARWRGIVEWLDEWRQDVRFANRQFGRNVGLTAIAVVTLALGIGANTAIFSVVHRLLLDPLPFPNGDRLVFPMQDDGRGGVRRIDANLLDAWQERARSIEGVAAAWDQTFAMREDGTVDYVPNGGLTPNFLETVGVRPPLGRVFTGDEMNAPVPTVAMISYGRWQRDYDGRPDAIGSTVELAGNKYTIVGVTPRDLIIPNSATPTPEIWVPAKVSRGAYVIAMLRLGATAATATRELEAIAKSLPVKGPVRTGLRVMRQKDFLDRRATRSIEVLFVAVAALLLIACANVANLLLARAWTRRREFAVRTALGADRGRLARQILTESMLLALAGGVLGVGVAWQTMRVIIALRPPSLNRLDDVRIESPVLLWSLGVSIATGLLFGCLPAFFAGARNAGDVLRNETRAGSFGLAASRMRSGLIVLEIATSLVLLVGAGLLVRSLTELQRTRLGFDPHGLAHIAVIPNSPTQGREATVRQALLDRIRAVPGVTDVAMGTLPGEGYSIGGLETHPDASGQKIQAATVGAYFVTPEYFRVAHIVLLEGRLPDSLTSPATAGILGFSREVVVNRALARRLWPNGGAIGSPVNRIWNVERPPGSGPESPSTVVGIVDDVHMPGVRDDLRTLQVYSLRPPRFPDFAFLVRAAGRGEDAMPALEKAVKKDPTLLFFGVKSGEAYLRNALAPTRFAMALLTAFAVIALVLAVVGLYGVIAYGVTQRTREIGVRVALGAEPRAVTRLVVVGGLRLAVAGVVIGTVVAVATTRLLESMLYGVTATDPLTFTFIVLTVATVAVVASYIPARRALRIDPTDALRAD